MSAKATVLSYIQDFHRAWLRTDADPAQPFEAWQAAVDDLVSRYFVPDATCPHRNSLRSPSPLDPDQEQVLEVLTRDGHTEVVTQRGTHSFYRYTLTLVADGWRITTLVETASHPSTPLLSEESAAALGAQTASVTAAEAASVAPPPWWPGRSEAPELTRRAEGDLSVESGIFVACDVDAHPPQICPPAMRVPPGSHPVELYMLEEDVAGVVVRFGDPEAVVRWTPATATDESDHVAIETGYLILADFHHLATWTLADRQAACEALAHTLPTARQQPLQAGKAALVVAAGWGDGAYRGMWGLDAEGRPIVWAMDFALIDDHDGG